MKIVLSKERPISWNKLYSGKFWQVRQVEALRIHSLLRFELNQLGIRGKNDNDLMQNRVDITVTAYFDKNAYDSDNIPAKFYIDGLKGLLYSDDSRKFIRNVTTRSEIDKLDPRVEIEILEIGGEIEK